MLIEFQSRCPCGSSWSDPGLLLRGLATLREREKRPTRIHDTLSAICTDPKIAFDAPQSICDWSAFFSLYSIPRVRQQQGFGAWIRISIIFMKPALCLSVGKEGDESAGATSHDGCEDCGGYPVWSKNCRNFSALWYYIEV
ncbi:MAG: hypothetical protein H0Z34_14675 [Brevibacillus sp.]|nr:hypothetical protein [Brevibacillus sp.]